MYLKKDYGAFDRAEDVLVIETNFSDYKDEDDSLMALLDDLQSIQMIAESKVGHFDRVDIRS
jgi:hypothetical protein